MINSTYRYITSPDFSDRNFANELEIKVATRFNVYPVDGWSAYQEFEAEDGTLKRVVFLTFVYGADGKQTPEIVNNLCQSLWDDIIQTFPIGSTVVWRLRPKVTVEDISDSCESCGHTTQERHRTYVRCRIGCLDPILVNHSHPEGTEVQIKAMLK